MAVSLRPVRTVLTAALAMAALVAGAAAASPGAEKITLYTNWIPDIENGGFYQAKAAGIYDAYGVDCDLKNGGPQVNGRLLLLGGEADFAELHTSGELVSAVEHNAPLVALAAFYQKDPQIIVSHKGMGYDSLESLKGVPILLTQDAFASFWPWLKARYGYTDAQVRPYTNTVAQFLSDNKVVQQAYLTNEPYAMKKQGADPNIFLLSDHGWSTYTAILVTRRDMVEKHPDLVRRVVQATIQGWYSMLEDPTPAIAYIKREAPDTSDGQIAYSLAGMKANGIVLSGDAVTLGIGAMTDARWSQFYNEMSAIGLYKTGLDYRSGYTLAFVDDPAFVARMEAKYPHAIAHGAP